MTKIITLIAMLLPALLPLHNASTGIFFLIVLWYISIFLIVSLAILEQNNVK